MCPQRQPAPRLLPKESQHHREWASSLLPLPIGWLGVLEAYFGWFANPLLFVAWILLLIPRARRAALICSLPALLRSPTTLIQRPDIWGDNDKAVIIQFGAGCWLWLASISVALAGSILKFQPI